MSRRHLIVLLLLIFCPCVRAADAPFAKEIRAFEAADARKAPPKNAVLFIGSSSIRFWKTLAQDFPDWPVINRGFGGSEISDSVRYADRIAIPYHPRQIVMYAGDNDLAAGKSPQRVLADFKAFVDEIHAALPDVPIHFIAIKPCTLRWKLIDKVRRANRLIEDYAAGQKNVDYVDIFTPMLGPDGKPRKDLLKADGLHPSRKCYELWASIIRPRLRAASGGSAPSN